jgi:hypothetical protein
VTLHRDGNALVAEIAYQADHPASVPRRETLQNGTVKGDDSGDKEAVSP